MAFHLGVAGRPNDNFSYRLMASYQDGLGTYAQPFTKVHHNMSVLLEAGWNFTRSWLRGVSVRGSLGADFGAILGNNQGVQITISKRGLLK